MNVNVIDLETFWNSKSYTLSKMGAIEYSRDTRAECQMIGVSVNGAPAQVYENVQECLARFDMENDIFVAHNGANFDYVFLHEQYGFAPKHMWDSIFMMRWTGISRVCGESHKALTEYLGNGVKQAGTVVSDGKHWPDDFTPEEQAFFRQYCADDVNQCRDNCKAMLPYLTEDACRFMSITARMATEPAFIIDKNILQEYISGQDSKKQDALKSLGFANITDMLTHIRSAEKFAGLLRGLGVDPPMKWSARKKAEDYAFAKTDAAFIDLLEHEDARVRELVRARLDMNGSGVESKAKTLLKFAEGDKELPIILSAWKAHTSRYSGGTTKETASDGIQMQNLTKRNPVHKKIRQAITVHDGMTVVACDSSQIEARCLAWIAGQNNLVEQFREGRDPYAELAAKFGSGYTAQEIHDGAKAGDKEKEKLRNIGKLGILSSGYGIGASSFARKLWTEGTKLAGNSDDHEQEATKYHAIYRQENPAIVAFWKQCQNILADMAAGRGGVFGGPYGDLFEYGLMPILGDEKHMVPSILLPSGYMLRYPGLRYEKGEFVADVQDGNRSYPKHIYGGLLTENVVSAFAFQILMWQGCRLDERGVALKGNNHDCWYTVVPDSQKDWAVAQMTEVMSMTPAWADGLPIACECKTGNDFSIC